MDDRLTELEVKMAHQDQQIADLSEMVSEQWNLIQRLGTLLSKADARIESLENNSPTDNQFDEKPPHY